MGTMFPLARREAFGQFGDLKPTSGRFLLGPVEKEGNHKDG